jgi:hypothetical protein
MEDPLDSVTGRKIIDFLRMLYELRAILDVYCLICANAITIKDKDVSGQFFAFLQRCAVRLITIDICKMFEREKHDKNGNVVYSLSSIDGVLLAVAGDGLSVQNVDRLQRFLRKYGDENIEVRTSQNDDTIRLLEDTVRRFRSCHEADLKRFKDVRDKRFAHSEFNPNLPVHRTLTFLPSCGTMEILFDFGHEFYRAIEGGLVGVGPMDLSAQRKVKISFIRLLEKVGLDEVVTEMQ